MKPNRILEKMRHGEKAHGAGTNWPSEEVVELCGIAGLDFINFDGQHGSFTPDVIERLCRVADGFGITPIMRVPDIEASTILSYLDRGIKGIMGPDVDTKEEAIQLVNACKFGPQGKRSFGSGRGNDWGLIPDRPKWMQECNNHILVMAQLESATAMKNIDEILSVPGVDLFAWGPMDLSQSLGFPGQPNHPKVTELHNMATEKIHKAGRKLTHEVMESLGINQVILDAAKVLMPKGKGGR